MTNSKKISTDTQGLSVVQAKGPGNLSEPEVFAVLRKIRYDLTAAQAKLTEAMNLLAAMNLPSREREFECKCGAGFFSERHLAFHMQNVHDGPTVPFSEAEEAA